MPKLSTIRYYIDYFLPREVMGPVVLVFSMENVVDQMFTWYIPDGYGFYGWLVILTVSALVIGYWGEVDEDMEQLEESIQEATQSDDVDVDSDSE